MSAKPILVLDFDGVIHSYQSKWSHPTIIPDPPVPGAFDFLTEAQKHFEVWIVSSRFNSRDQGSNPEHAVLAVYQWFKRHNFDASEIVMSAEKPPAFLTIDDRAITFEGTFPNVYDLLAFRPWNKR